MSDTPTLETALGELTSAIESWDPDEAPSVGPILAALKELQVHFDPRSDRLSASLCVTCMKLLEELQGHGQVGREAAVGVVGELALGLKESLHTAAAAPQRPSTARPFVTLKSSGASTGLSLALDKVGDGELDAVMLKMGFVTREQADKARAIHKAKPDKPFEEIFRELGYASDATIEKAQRLLSRTRGQLPPPGPQDAWGASAL